MKILFITDNFPPEVNAPASRTFEHCREWVKNGEEVTVLTGVPNFPQGRVYPGYKNKLYQVEYIDGIKVVRVWTYITSNEGFIRRITDYISFCVMSFIASLFIKTDLIIATSPQFFTAVSGCFSAMFKRTPWIMEIRDLWPESIKAVGAMREGFIYKALVRLEYFLYRKANALVVVTDSFKSHLVENGVPSNKIHIIKNGVLLDRFSPLEPDSELLNKLKLNSSFVVGYIGTFGMAHALDFIVDCAQFIPSNVKILLIGDGAEKRTLLEQIERLDLSNVVILPPVPKSEVPRYISCIDVALVNLKNNDTFKNVIPSKIFESAAMMKPILLGVEGESKALVESFEAGLSFIPEDRTSFLNALESIQNIEHYRKLQLGGKKLSQAFDRKSLALQLLTLVRNLYGKNMPPKRQPERLELY